jgi:glycosyltransferase involved in cell wall biosynthesis
MPNTFSNLSDKNEHLPEVEVLLATFNGEIYLSEFLESLRDQHGVKIHLRVSDDGSTDRTLEIIEACKNEFASCKIYSGPRKGPSANFFSLIQKSSYQFVALADQDDIWLPNHLLLSLRRLTQTPDMPSITFSAVREFGQELISDKVWPKRFPGEDVRTILTENLARGCTFVLNSKAVNLVNLHKPTNAVMHDWWVLLLIYCSGAVTWSTMPEVNYRIHQNNAVGSAPSFQIRRKRFFKNIISRDWKIFNQAEELLQSYSWSMSSKKRHEIGSFLRDLGSPLFTGRVTLILWPHRFRSALMDEVAIRIAFLIKKRRRGGLSSMGIFVFQRLRILIAQLTFFIATLRIRIRTFFDYRFTKKFYKYNVVKTIEKHSTRGLAIVALYPRTGIFKSVNRLIDSLLDSNYAVLVVMNQSSLTEEWIHYLSDKPIEILTRPNIGRDFGAYKIGFLYAEKNGYLTQIDHLLFANDSVMYGPQSIGCISTMLKVDLPWHALFVNYQHHTHAQSFFQVFNKDIFQKNSFSKFWHHYYPSELRHHAINDGEVGLSSTCLGLGFSPVSYVNAKSILEDVNFGNFTPDEKFGIWSNHSAAFLDGKLSSFENSVFLMRRQYLEINITHHQGLLASRVLKAPLKLDLFKSGQTTIDGLRDTLISLGLDQDELKDVLAVMTLNGTHASRRGFKRLWGSYGLI